MWKYKTKVIITTKGPKYIEKEIQKFLDKYKNCDSFEIDKFNSSIAVDHDNVGYTQVIIVISYCIEV